ncbi:hypothetical protein FKW44_000193 [Caligus rogercresseyi]|uniref:DNA mismatch repair proteins mutS family domain-containing protein n=1 Tax=Caligus rogercresseyi TaxID=217165 RepID=A0A7T8KH57_CALRO|nr:hypothetical protein FKW44_000193 [Caligus rogercresseyi]
MPIESGQGLTLLKYLGAMGIGVIEIPIPSEDYDLKELLKRVQSFANNKESMKALRLIESLPLALSSFQYLDANVCEEDVLLGDFEVRLHPVEEYMTLDDPATISLDLFSETPASPCLFKLLNHCRTNGGSRMLKKWIRQPRKDEKIIRLRLNIVEILVDNTDLRESLHKDVLRRLPDLENLSLRLAKKTCSLAQLYSIFTGISDVRRIIDLIQEAQAEGEALSSHFLPTLQLNTEKMKGFQDMIRSSLDFEAIQSGEFFIKSSFDENLEDLKNQMNDLKSDMDSEANRVSRDLGLDSSKNLKLQHGDALGHFFKITLKFESHIREKSGIDILESSKSGLKFQTKKLTSLSQDYEVLKKEYNQIQKKIVKEVLDIAFGYSKFAFRLGTCLSQLDVLLSFATAALASPIPYVKPSILDQSTGKRIIKMLGVRHPCMEISPKISSYIPNDIHFDSNSSRFHILTGPNLGGKSTYMRSIAVCMVMAQIGSFVPCDMADIYPVDKILVRIGSEDRQLEGVSTFMAEMLDVSNILRTATPNSLIIIDEIGRGTSTYDGIGIALAVAQKIISDLKIFTIFATHFFEITHLSASHEGVKNFHVSADTSSGSFTLLYKVLEGECNKSFGLEVAKLCNFPEELIKESTERLEKYEASQNTAKYLDLSSDQYEEIHKILKNLPSEPAAKKKCLLGIKDTYFNEEKWSKLMELVESRRQ